MTSLADRAARTPVRPGPLLKGVDTGDAVLRPRRFTPDERHRAALYVAGMWAWPRHGHTHAGLLLAADMVDALGLNDRPMRQNNRRPPPLAVCAGCYQTRQLKDGRKCRACLNTRPLITCLECRRPDQKHAGRGLCGACHRRELRAEQRLERTA